MNLFIKRAVAIKPEIIRFDVELHEDSDVTAEFSIAVDVGPYLTVDYVKQEVLIKFDGVKAYIQQQVELLMMTSTIATTLTNMTWRLGNDSVSTHS